MGETRNIIMVHVRSTLLFAAILVFVSGLPHGADEYQQASTEINMLLQQGKDQSACADLAKTLVDEVTASVKLSNKLLADLHDGSSCPSEGQKAVKAAQRNKDAADKAAREAATAASKASGAEIDFGAYSLSSLTEDKCGQFWENKAYKSAKAAAAAADSAKTTADAKAKAAAGALDDETKAAAEAVKACQCQVRKSYDSAWTAANKNNEANQASYTKGKHMECVLEGRAAAECDAGDAPKPNPVTLADGVPAEPCAKTGHSGSVTCKLTIDNSLNTVKYNGQQVQVNGNKGNWNQDKTISFKTVSNGVLEVMGHDSEGGNSGHCRSAGFAIQCESSNDPWWDKFDSGSNNIRAAGGSQSNSADSWKNWKAPCTTTSRFSLPANRGLKKLWAPGGERYAKFQMGPSCTALVCTETKPVEKVCPRERGYCV